MRCKLLREAETGEPLIFFQDCSINQLRTGAAGAIGAKVLARPDAHRLTVFGSAVHAQSQLKAADRMSKSISMLQIILVIAAIWPQTAATFLDKDTGEIPVWATSLRAFVLVMFVPFLLMCVAAYFVIQPIFVKFVKGPINAVLARAGQMLSRSHRGSKQS